MEGPRRQLCCGLRARPRFSFNSFCRTRAVCLNAALSAEGSDEARKHARPQSGGARHRRHAGVFSSGRARLRRARSPNRSRRSRRQTHRPSPHRHRTVPEGFGPIEKTAFSSCGAQEFVTRLEEAGARQILVCGIETHICVNQTTHDLLGRGYQVHILTDCVSSRSAQNREIGLTKMFRSGALPSSIELALFELLRDARHEQFKAIQKLIK
jgi:hypothetical protein